MSAKEVKAVSSIAFKIKKMVLDVLIMFCARGRSLASTASLRGILGLFYRKVCAALKCVLVKNHNKYKESIVIDKFVTGISDNYPSMSAKFHNKELDSIHPDKSQTKRSKNTLKITLFFKKECNCSYM